VAHLHIPSTPNLPGDEEGQKAGQLRTYAEHDLFQPYFALFVSGNG